MDENRPKRRRNLSPAEQKALDKQRRKEKELEIKRKKADAKYREQVRRQRRMNGEDPHIVIEIPARPQNPAPKPKPKKPKRRPKTTPDIIKEETNKRVRNMAPKDYGDGYYIDEVEVRKAQAREQRRKRQKKQPKALTPKQRKMRRILAYISICAVVIIIGVVLSLTVLFKTETIEVRGNQLYDNDTIIELAEVSKGENIFVATMFGNTDAVEDKLPYVKEAKVSFSIPDKIIIDIVHEEPYYALKSNGECYLINEKGRILEKVHKVPKRLMLVTAGSLKKAEVGSYVSYKNSNITSAVKKISQCLIDNNYKGVTAINVQKMAQISITYDNRILIKIGLPKDLDYKIRTAFTIINKKLDPNNLGKIRGVLNVSECKETKKSYFNEGDFDEEELIVATMVTQETTESESVRSTFVTLPPENTQDPTGQTDYTQTATEAVE